MEKKQNIITIILCFIMVLFGLGLWAQKALLVTPITEALKMERSVYSIADTMRYVATAIVNFFFGFLIIRFGAKKLIISGFVSLILSAICYAFANGIFILALGGFLLGIGLSWTGTAVVAYIVDKVCKEKKGTIMGFILAANGIGGCVATLIITPFINGNEIFGYRKFFYIMIAILVVVLLLIVFLFKEPKGIIIQEEKKDSTEWEGLEWKEACKKPYFYLACFCIFCTGMILQGVTGIYAARMKDVGIAQNIISIMAICSSIFLALFKFFNGFMYDKKGLRFTITIDCVASILVMIVLLFVTNSTFGIILGFSYTVLSAIALPLETVIVPIYAKELFGQKAFAKILGIFVSLNQIGYAVSSPLINLCYDITESYDIALIICAVIMFVIVLCLQYVISQANKIKNIKNSI